MAKPDFLAGQTLAAGRLRSIAPWTLLFTGAKSIPSSGTTDTVVDTLANSVSNSEIPYSVTSGVVTLIDGGLFLVSLVGAFGTTASGQGSVRRVHARGSVFGSSRLAPFAFAATLTSGTGLHVCGASPIEIQPGETIDVLARQDSTAANTVTVYLGFTKLA